MFPNTKWLNYICQDKITKLGDLIGKSVQNASEHHATINIQLGINEKIYSVHELLNETQRANEMCINDLKETQAGLDDTKNRVELMIQE